MWSRDLLLRGLLQGQLATMIFSLLSLMAIKLQRIFSVKTPGKTVRTIFLSSFAVLLYDSSFLITVLWKVTDYYLSYTQWLKKEKKTQKQKHTNIFKLVLDYFLSPQHFPVKFSTPNCSSFFSSLNIAFSRFTRKIDVMQKRGKKKCLEGDGGEIGRSQSHHLPHKGKTE